MSYVQMNITEIRCDMCNKIAPLALNTPMTEQALRAEVYDQEWFMIENIRHGTMDLCSDACLRKYVRQLKTLLALIEECEKNDLDWREEMRKGLKR